MTPFEVVYGQKPSSILSYMPIVWKVREVEKNIIVRENILLTLKENLVMDHNQMKQRVDQGHFECQFAEGD
jgi:hypothetical protein